MPVVLLERLPLPSLRAYTSFSVLFLSLAFYHAHQVVHQERDLAKSNVSVTANGVNVTSEEGNSTENVTDSVDVPLNKVQDLKIPEEYNLLMLNVLLEETWCVWVSHQTSVSSDRV